MRDNRPTLWLLWGTLVLAGVLLCLTLVSPGAKLPSLTQSHRLGFTGEYSLNGSTERLPYTAQTRLSAAKLTTVTFYGHFTQAVKAGEQIVMRIPNLRVTMLINARTVFTFGDSHPSFYHSGGSVWASFTCDGGVQPTDDVELRMSNVYPSDSLSSFDDFFIWLTAGSEYTVYRDAIKRNADNIILGTAITFIGLAMLGVSLYARVLKVSRATDYSYLSAFVLASGIWTGVDYNYITILIPYPIFCKTLEMLSMMLLPAFLFRYLLSLLHPRFLPLGRVALFATLGAAAVSLGLQLAGLVDLPVLTVPFTVLDTISILAMAYCLIRSLKPPCNADQRSAILPLFLLFIGALLNFANFFLDWQTGGLFYALFFFAFALVELLRLIRTLQLTIRRNNEYVALQNELTQSRIAVMLSQIKPHFLFNALNAISALCLTDPIMADQAITSLSNYLRGNIRSLEQSAPVPFEQELDHIKYYVRLEQLRYGDKLRVVYAIDTVDFQVPTLSLQTLVENAIRHGVSPRPEGGVVVVQTEQGQGFITVRIIDNGVGFDPDLKSRNADSIGLANAKKRMEAMIGATLTIESVPGTGTTITIRIPEQKGKISHENHLRG